MTPRSAFVLATIRGRWTLTATSVPSWSVARWTWAVEAAANGSWSIEAYRSSGGLPSSPWISWVASSQENGAASLWSLDSSVTQAAGRRSARLAAI